MVEQLQLYNTTLLLRDAVAMSAKSNCMRGGAERLQLTKRSASHKLVLVHSCQTSVQCVEVNDTHVCVCVIYTTAILDHVTITIVVHTFLNSFFIDLRGRVPG